ncbi:Signal transduction histidine kinase [Butyrivibrio fibrisolvens DSM 3071]|uniref:Circadian input-output histidine kinase CikA n=1 Tax=Butyrivibrio fibrisolvens DSM 3071 TaxID=1121131 RepID=A0A1M6GCL3_BUTFI|nr:response regulator [Butyrivibrio fibrisolvens]SHJ07685.1 Signal transduction histidine kinase [Butyrivibrio fibrisolvens DSM 3071]
MKKRYIIIINILIIGLILFIIVKYANDRATESDYSSIASFENMTTTTAQIIANYLEDEQHLCDIWANYINGSADAGTPMTIEEAISYIRKAKISPEISGHLIYIDDGSMAGISTTASTTDPSDYSVKYSHISIFENLEISNVNGAVNLTRAYTNPLNGVQSIAFLNNVKVVDSETGAMREGLIIRVVPVSRLEQKLVFLKGEYENVEISLIDWDGDYMIHGKSLKNSNFFEYFKSYNPMSTQEYNKVMDAIRTGTGSMHIRNSKREDSVIAYTPLSGIESWFLVAYIPAKELTASRSIDWLLLGIVSVGLMVLLHFNIFILLKFNRKLSVAAQAANQANEAKSLFLSTMSHDIRTPMNAIIGMNEMILRKSSDDETLMYSESIRTAGNTLLGIINDILDFSKIEAGKMEIIDVDYNFVSLLNDLVNMVQRRAEEKGLSFELDVDRNIPGIMHGDEIRIKQVITNILSNAVKYTKEGGIVFSVSGQKCEDNEDYVILHVSVKDTGIGIKKEDLDRLFVAFERIEEKRNRNIEGTGLGMAIAQSFLEMMDSKLQVESEYGKGSVFSFDLKQKVVKWEPIGDFDTAFKRFLSERKKYRVQFVAPKAKMLVVDDTEVNLKVFCSLLSETRMQIETADSGDACIALFKRIRYDVIFLDHMMPDKDGIETLKEMKALLDTPNKDTPVICLTANAVSGMREMYINAGFDDYLTKPIDTGRLESMLLRYLPPELVEKPADTSGDDDKKAEAKRSILVVDSDIAFLRQVKEWLSDSYNVVVVKSKEQALTYLEKHDADLILIDLNEESQNGFDKSKIIRNNFREIDRDEIISQVNEFFDDSTITRL